MAYLRESAKKNFAKYVDTETAQNIEKGLYNFAIDSSPICNWECERFIFEYKNRYTLLYRTLQRNKEYSESLSNSTLDPLYFGERMTADEMDPQRAKRDDDDWKKLISKNVLLSISATITEPSELKCFSCASQGRDAYKVVYNQKQIRSADEPMTIFAYCTVCEKRWKTS